MRAGVDVLVHDAEGSLRSRAKTDAQGAATVETVAGGSVSFVYDEGLDRLHVLHTYLGLGGGADFTHVIDDVVDEQPDLAPMHVIVTPSSTGPAADHYVVEVSCDREESVQPGGSLDLPVFVGCGGRPYDLLVTARDANDRPIAYGVVQGAAFQAGKEVTHTVVADKTVLVEHAVEGWPAAHAALDAATERMVSFGTYVFANGARARTP